LPAGIVTQPGLGANLPEDAIYPINLAESSAIPPVNAFWSVTLYDAEGYQAPNSSLNRFAVSSWTPFEYDPDGSLDLISRTKAPAPTRRRTGCRRRKGPST
jgi:hypothetical protein